MRVCSAGARLLVHTPASSCMGVHPALSGPAAFAVDVPPIRWWAGSRALKCVCPRAFRHPAICLDAVQFQAKRCGGRAF